MINLLTIIATLFAGVNIYNNNISSGKIDINYDFTVNEIDTVDESSINYNFELTPIISVYSTFFEAGTSLTNEAFNSIVVGFNVNDKTLIDVASIDVEFVYFSPYIMAYASPVSYLNVVFNYYCEFTINFTDNSTFTDFYEDTYDVKYYTNFGINYYFEVYDDNFEFIFNVHLINDLGYDAGYDEGYTIGYDDGFETGFNDGYQNGSNDLSEVFNGSWVDWLGRAVTGFFALEIFPNFTLGGAIGSIVVVWLMIWILKVFAGG